MKAKDMIEGIRYKVIVGSKCGTIQEGEIIYRDKGDICSSSWGGSLSRDDAEKIMSSVGVVLAQEWGRRKADKLKQELKRLCEDYNLEWENKWC
ncbi:MAG: hypothetical protein GY679_01935 [Mycoplasma sp.]|nr:hypothetical protein [Mycoplasma sp.]